MGQSRTWGRPAPHVRLEIHFSSVVNKDLTLKAKAKAKDLTHKAKAKDLTHKAKAKAKDLPSRTNPRTALD